MKQKRKPRKFDDTHLMTGAEIRIEVTPHIDFTHDAESIVLTCTDKRANGREAEILFDDEADIQVWSGWWFATIAERDRFVEWHRERTQRTQRAEITP